MKLQDKLKYITPYCELKEISPARLQELLEKEKKYDELVKKDYEEPKVGYIIDPMEEDCVSADDSGYEVTDVERAKELGIWFETEEQAEKAVEKLKALKRLKEKGFSFDGWTIDDGLKISICTNFEGDNIYSESEKETRTDLDLLFGGEE